MILIPSYLTTNQSEESPWVDRIPCNLLPHPVFKKTFLFWKVLSLVPSNEHHSFLHRNSESIDWLSEKAMAPHSSTFAWKIPWTEKPGGLQSMGSRRVGHDWATSLSLFTFMPWRRKWHPTPVFLPGESQGRGAWWAAIYGITQSRTRLKWLSSSSSRLALLHVGKQTRVCFGNSPRR